MTTLLGMSATIESQLNNLATTLDIDVATIENDIESIPVQLAFPIIQTHYGDLGGSDSMATFFSSTFTNTCPDTNQQQTLIVQFANDVVNTWSIDAQVNTIHLALVPIVPDEPGLLQGWTSALNLIATADNLFNCYQSLECYYAQLYNWIMQGAATYVEAENLLPSPMGGAWVSGTLIPNINKEVDQFEQCTYQMLLSKADFVNDFYVPQFSQFVPPVAATNILFRNMFMAAQARGTNAYGVNAMILATMDAVPNGMMPPIVAYQPQGPYYYPVTSRWISVASPNYPCWGNGRMHATNGYAFLQYGFGTNMPFGVYAFSPGLSDPPYAGNTLVGLYDDSLNASPTGNLYGCYVGQSRSTAAPYFSTTTTTHQVLGDTTHQGAIMSTAVQAYPAGTNVVVVSVLITNGPLDSKHINNSQGDITVNAYALWSFTYDGQTPTNGALQYQAATYGSYQTAP
ncbi:MAG: hypothetical protein Q8O57_10695, partial [Kiritimatiellota bacterium]|nr:hypothetical protein [Kiritimatiellota bacterium]